MKEKIWWKVNIIVRPLAAHIIGWWWKFVFLIILFVNIHNNLLKQWQQKVLHFVNHKILDSSSNEDIGFFFIYILNDVTFIYGCNPGLNS